jgi:hypothetical protein
MARGRFAHVCVEIDLMNLVVGKVGFRNNWYKVEYEGLHVICTLCGCYGHLSRNCERSVHPDVQPPIADGVQQHAEEETTIGGGA